LLIKKGGFQSEQVRGHQADWAPLLKWLKKAG